MRLMCALTCALLVTIAGCAKAPPAITDAEGVVLLDGEPLPNAQVQFIPDLKFFGSEYNSAGVTDEKGRFQLTCARKGQPGAAVATHWVIITDAAVPTELRGMDAESQAKLQAWQAALSNRPIPEAYASVGTTPLKIEVSKDKKTYELKLTRAR